MAKKNAADVGIDGASATSHASRQFVDSTAEFSSILRQSANELERALDRSAGTIRHVCFAAAGEASSLVTQSLIDATVGMWLGADKYDALCLGPARYPLCSNKSAELWHVLMINGPVGRMLSDWNSTLATLDRLTVSGSFLHVFSEVPASEGWLLFLYRLALLHPELMIGNLRGASLPESGGILPSPLLRDPEVFERWLTGREKLPNGDHFLLFSNDIRAATLRALRLAEAKVGAQIRKLTAVEAKRRGRPKGNYQEQRNDANITAKWKQARGAGVLKIDFARQAGMEPDGLDRVLNRERKREKARQRDLDSE